MAVVLNGDDFVSQRTVSNVDVDILIIGLCQLGHGCC